VLKDRKLTASEELTYAQKRWLDRRLAEDMADINAGRVHGPFASAKEASAYIERMVRERRLSKTPKRPGARI
jgi:hypothetical protein